MNDNDKQNALTPCPQWAESMLKKLHRIEVKLGNIQESEADSDDDRAAPAGWHSRSVDDLVSAATSSEPGESQPLSSPSEDGSSDLAEAIFDRVCAGLAEEGFTNEQIAGIINSRVGAGGRMKYCNAAEVAEALEAG